MKIVITIPMVIVNNPSIENKDGISLSVKAEINMAKAGTNAAKTEPKVDPNKKTDLL